MVGTGCCDIFTIIQYGVLWPIFAGQNREIQVDRGPVTRLTVDWYMPARLFDRTVYHRQTQLCAFADSLGGEKVLARGDTFHNSDIRLQAAFARKHHEARGQIGTKFRSLHRIRGQSATWGRWLGHVQEFNISDDNSQQVVEIMCNTARHVANCVHPLGPRQRVCGGFAQGQVMQNRDKYCLAVNIRASNRIMQG